MPVASYMCEQVMYRVKITERGCSLIMGKANRQPQKVSLSFMCATTPGAVQHEVMHASGFFHEMVHPSRDDYVTILWDNIIESMERNTSRLRAKIHVLL